MTDYVHLNPEFNDLPLLRVTPLKVDDDDIAFQSDISYMRVLLHEVHMQAAYGGRAQPFPIVLTDELDHALLELTRIKAAVAELSRG
jgi:hypothetical protein